MLPDTTPLEDVTFCALDLETTGANPALHRLIEIGMVSFTLDETGPSYGRLVNPEMPVSPRAYDIHGISSTELAGEPVVKEIMGEVISFLKGKILVIHNTRFDLSFMARACREASQSMPDFMALDTVVLAREAFPAMDNHRLDTLCRSLGVELNHHRALSDATACMHLFRRCLEKLDISSSDSLARLWRSHGSPVGPGEIKRLWPGKSTIEGICEGREVVIHYRDARGSVTERRILPREVIRYGRQTYLRAFCFLREEERVFRESRIMKIEADSPLLCQ